MDYLERKLCDIQGRLFQLSVEKGYDSKAFVKAFMNSKTAEYFDSSYNRLQWAGEEYILEETIDECKDKIENNGNVIDKEVIYWIGYVYRYWHFYKNESSRKIYKLAPFERMVRNYLMFHTMSLELAIEDLIDIHQQKKNNVR